MKKLPILVLFFALGPLANANEHILFLENIEEKATAYSEADMKKWNMGGERAAVPESADHKNLEHVKLLVAANPKRYEGYIMYGFHFLLKEEYTVAVVAYEKAIRIIEKEEIRDVVDFRDPYAIALISLFYQQQKEDKAKAAATFNKLVEYDFSFFEKKPNHAYTIAWVALHHYSKGNLSAAKNLIELAGMLPKIPEDVKADLTKIYHKIEESEKEKLEANDKKVERETTADAKTPRATAP